MTRRNWSELEVEATVADYFNMLDAELRGESFNKTAHRIALRAKLDNRSDGAVELKHQNISAILIDLGFPYIEGYKPRGNYQGLLREVVESRLTSSQDLLHRVEQEVTATAESVPSVEDFLKALVAAPTQSHSAPRARHVRENQGLYSPTDYLQQEARNVSLGHAGELFTINFEKARLEYEGEGGLADRIEHVSVSEGDGIGYDIRSFETDGSDRFIEVKTTRYGKDTPFFVSRNQVTTSAELDQRYHLYRLFRFRRDPKLFTVSGSLTEIATLEPVEFVARVP